MFLLFIFEGNLNEDFELYKAISEAKHDILIYFKIKSNLDYIKKLLVTVLYLVIVPTN